ncbi:MAG: hypothetical protein ACLR7Z_04520 [Bilophila wadsworthia]
MLAGPGCYGHCGGRGRLTDGRAQGLVKRQAGAVRPPASTGR